MNERHRNMAFLLFGAMWISGYTGGSCGGVDGDAQVDIGQHVGNEPAPGGIADATGPNVEPAATRPIDCQQLGPKACVQTPGCEPLFEIPAQPQRPRVFSEGAPNEVARRPPPLFVCVMSDPCRALDEQSCTSRVDCKPEYASPYRADPKSYPVGSGTEPVQGKAPPTNTLDFAPEPEVAFSSPFEGGPGRAPCHRPDRDDCGGQIVLPPKYVGCSWEPADPPSCSANGDDDPYTDVCPPAEPDDCAPVLCKMFCRYGFAVDSDTGCEVCECAAGPDEPDRLCHGLEENRCIEHPECEPEYERDCWRECAEDEPCVLLAPESCEPESGYVGCHNVRPEPPSDPGQCKPVACRMYCENGFAVDPSTGCEVCECNPEPPSDPGHCEPIGCEPSSPEGCPDIVCAAIHCEHGFETDPTTGCGTCTCAEAPSSSPTSP